jgi:hypothetical protein
MSFLPHSGLRVCLGFVFFVWVLLTAEKYHLIVNTKGGKKFQLLIIPTAFCHILPIGLVYVFVFYLLVFSTAEKVYYSLELTLRGISISMSFLPHSAHRV